MNHLRQVFILVLIFLFPAFIKGQKDQGVDSLLKVAETKSGIEKPKFLYVMADRIAYSDTARAFELAKKAFDLSRTIGYEKGIPQYYFFKARVAGKLNGQKEAFNMLSRSLQYIDTTKPNSNYGSYYITFAGLLSDVSQYTQASGNYLKALKIFDQVKDTAGIARAYHGLGMTNDYTGDMKESIRCYKQASIYYALAGMKPNETSVVSNLGSLYVNHFIKTKNDTDFKQAEAYFTKGLELGEQYKLYETMGNNYNNLSSLYGAAGKYDKSLEYAKKAYEFRVQHGLKSGISTSQINIANLYFLMGNTKEAEKNVLEGLHIARELNMKRTIVNGLTLLSDIYQKENKKDLALDTYKESVQLRDSIFNVEKEKAMADMEKKYDSDKKDQKIELLNQAKQVQDAELTKQKVVNYAIGLGLTLVVIFSFFLLRANRERKKANEELSIQKNIIEEKNRHITDSINYAKTIQSAIIPDKDEFSNNFSDAFVCYFPKDIVSGDFYWIASSSDKVFFAVVDCTGHGVPGGFMCMLGSSLLSEIVNERNVTSPSRVLEQLREKIMGSLRQTGQSGESRDGMDLVFCRYDKTASKLTYSTAYNSFYLLRKNELIESEVNKMPVGYHHKMGPFKEFELQLQKGDTLYLFTDGYADQFGGKDKKKFKYSRLKNLLLSVNEKGMKEQKDIVEKTILDWKGDLEQVDDICLIGIKI